MNNQENQNFAQQPQNYQNYQALPNYGAVADPNIMTPQNNQQQQYQQQQYQQHQQQYQQNNMQPQVMGQQQPQVPNQYSGYQQQQQEWMQQQGGKQEPMMPGGGDMSSVWPNGIGLIDRNVSDPEGCSCPPCLWMYCPCLTGCGRPFWFSTAYGNGKQIQYGKEFVCQPRCCGWKMTNADALGQNLTFEGKNCGKDHCWEPEVEVHENQRYIGKAIMKVPCTKCCSEQVLTEARDASGSPRLFRYENPCCPLSRLSSQGCCGEWRYDWPVVLAGQPSDKVFTHVTAKFHGLCFICHPVWFGIESVPNGISADDQKLLLTMAITRWWRMEQQQQDSS